MNFNKKELYNLLKEFEHGKTSTTDHWSRSNEILFELYKKDYIKVINYDNHNGIAYHILATKGKELLQKLEKERIDI